MKKLFVIDPDCRNEKSHNMLATYRACHAARAAGYRVDAVVNKVFPRANTLLEEICDTVMRDWPTFAFNDADTPDNPNITTYHEVYDSARPRWEKFYYALLDLHHTAQVDAQSVLFIHTTSAPSLMGMLQYLLALDPAQRPRFYCLLYCMDDIIQGPQLSGVSNLQVLERLRDEGLIGTHVFFHVETVGLQEHYQMLGFDFPVVMGPLDQLEDVQKKVQRKSARKVVSFLGEAREEKGFHLVPEIIEAIERLNTDMNLGHKIEYRIQTYSNPTNATRPTLDAVDRVKAQAARGVPVVILDELTKDMFADELKLSDVMLMPYDIEAYRARGSGVVYDSLMFGARVVCTPGTDMHKTFADYGVSVPDAPDAESFGAQVLRVLDKDDTPDISGLEKYNIDRFFGTLLEAHAPTVRALDVAPSQGRCLHGLVLPVDGGHGFVERAQIKMLGALGMHRVIFGVPWVNGLDGMAYFRDHFVEFYFNAPETRGAAICFPKVIDDAAFRKIFAMYHDGSAAMYTQTVFLNMIAKYVSCGPVLELLLKIAPVDSALLNYAWLSPMIDKIRAAQPDTDVRMICEVHDYQSQQNIFRREAYSEARDLNWRAQDIRADLDSETQIEAASLTRFDHNVYISDTLRGQLAGSDAQHDHVIYPPNINFPQDVTAGALKLAPKVVDYICANGLVELDLLFVGTAHEANRASLVFLLDQVMPQVRAKGPATLFIVGNIDKLFTPEQQSAYAQERSFFMGRVDDINAWYMTAKIVSLAVTTGTGFPTKVIETLSLGQCFSATEAAFYELADVARAQFKVAQTANDMARDIVALLNNPDARSKRALAGRAFYDTHFSQAKYITHWSDALGVKALEAPHEPVFAHTEANNPFREAFQASALPLTLDRIHLAQAQTGLFGDWSHPENQYRWIDGSVGRMILIAPTRVLITSVTYFARLSEAVSSTNATVRISINGTLLGERRVNNTFDEYTLQSADGIWVEGVVEVLVECPEGQPLGMDTRNLSTLFEFIEFDFVEDEKDRTPFDTTVYLGREFDLEGPYPHLGVERQFTWIGRGGVLLTAAHQGEIEGVLRVEGFTDLSDQALEVRVEGDPVDEIPATGKIAKRAEFAVEFPVKGKSIEIAALEVGQFPAPDNRIIGIGIYQVSLDGTILRWR